MDVVCSSVYFLVQVVFRTVVGCARIVVNAERMLIIYDLGQYRQWLGDLEYCNIYTGERN